MKRAIEIEFGDGRKLKFYPGPSFEAKKIVSAEWEAATDRVPPEILCSQGHRQKMELMRDPWAHRSDGMRCRTCMWWVQKRPDEAGILVPDKIIGRCRRHAPTIQGFPVVFEHDWCGDHKLDEAKA